MIRKKNQVITNTISNLPNPCNFNHLSKTLAADLTISLSTQVEKHWLREPKI